MKEEEEEERVETIAEVLEEAAGTDSARPVAAADAVEARKEIVKEHYRSLAVDGAAQSSAGARADHRSVQRMSDVSPAASSIMEEHSRQQLERPNLDIPIQGGDSYVTLAQ